MTGHGWGGPGLSRTLSRELRHLTADSVWQLTRESESPSAVEVVPGPRCSLLTWSQFWHSAAEPAVAAARHGQQPARGRICPKGGGPQSHAFLLRTLSEIVEYHGLILQFVNHDGSDRINSIIGRMTLITPRRILDKKTRQFFTLWTAMKTQEDFDSLAIPEQANVFMDDVCLSNESCMLERKTVENYVPVNFIPEAALKMIMTWQLQRQDQMEISGYSSITAAVPSPNVTGAGTGEHERFYAVGAPPKRFYRTFWRSIARRLLE